MQGAGEQPWGRVARLGLSPFKGGRHAHPTSVDISRAGPVGDRRFALVEEHRTRGAAVVRTVENHAVLRVRAELAGDSLRLDVAGQGRFSVPVADHDPVAAGPDTAGPDTAGPDTDEVLADYWGRATRLRHLPGPWDDALSALLGRPVRLAEAVVPGSVVYAEPVTLVTTASLAELARRGGVDRVDDERFRATVLVDTVDARPFVEDDLAGVVVRVGEVELEVVADVPRCAVVRLVPGTGARADDDPLALLAPDRTREQEVVFGVGALVRRPGRIKVGDLVSLA